ncbi:MAG: membrane protein [Alphaproteobacteria bacterium]|nr:MAG: membrane protein [Alphaproteobacteria bacterium]
MGGGQGSAGRLVMAALELTNSAVGYAMALGLAAMTACTLLQVTVRFVLTKFDIMISVPWTEELARYLMIWLVFLGAATACRRGQLIAFDFLIEALPERAGMALRLLTALLCLAFFLLLIWIGVKFVSWGTFERSPVMTISKAWVYAAMPVSAVLMIVNSLAFLIEDLSGSAQAASDVTSLGFE